MSFESRQLDPIEEALLELDVSERARVFARTPVDSGKLLADSATVGRSRRVPLRLAAVAAAVAVAVSVWSWMLSRELAEVAERRVALRAFVEGATASRLSGFQSCFGGPADVLPPTCREHDFDADGDVDLLDFSAFQLSYAGG